jgi:hypothetical protein
MAFTAAERVDALNIGLMLMSAVIAMVIPFETFLFVYAVLGPLHYLTEISWLHDRQYFTKGKYDSVVLLGAAALLTLYFLNSHLELGFPTGFDGYVVYVAFLSSLIFIFVKNKFYKWGGIILLILTSQIANNFALFFTLFLPTLVHVYVFTMLFMLYGAFKSKSRVGLLSVFVLLLCPVLLFVIYPDRPFYVITEFGQKAYESFKYLNILSLMKFFEHPLPPQESDWYNIIFHSQKGILLMRFIAFAYTYHYLNWFSKTSIIQWHKVPKWRFALVIALWIASIALYKYNYVVGFQWLYFMSFLHVLLEFPLNMVSISGIMGHLKNQVWKPKPAPQMATGKTGRS